MRGGTGPLARAGHLDERDAAPTGLEHLGRSPAFTFLPNSPLATSLIPVHAAGLEPISCRDRPSTSQSTSHLLVLRGHVADVGQQLDVSPLELED